VALSEIKTVVPHPGWESTMEAVVLWARFFGYKNKEKHLCI
jgi:hypothetical protein